METLKFGIIFTTLALTLPSGGAVKEDSRPKRILLEDNYYTIVNKLDNLSKKVENLEAENAVLNKQVETLKSSNALLTQHIHSNVAFNAILTTTIAGPQRQVIIFDHVELNIGNAYSVLHGNFLAPVNGTYQFSIYTCSETGHVIVLDLMRNGSIVGHLLAGDKDYADCSSSTFLLALKKGDDVYVSEGSYGDYLYSRNTFGYPRFTGILLSAN